MNPNNNEYNVYYKLEVLGVCGDAGNHEHS